MKAKYYAIITLHTKKESEDLAHLASVGTQMSECICNVEILAHVVSGCMTSKKSHSVHRTTRKMCPTKKPEVNDLSGKDHAGISGKKDCVFKKMQ